MLAVPAQVEEARLAQWYAAKKPAWNRARDVYKTSRLSLSKRVEKAEGVRSDTLQDINIKFETCAPPAPCARPWPALSCLFLHRGPLSKVDCKCATRLALHWPPALQLLSRGSGL